MSQLKFQLDFLDAIVGTLRRMAGEHEDMARSLHGHASSAQSLGADGWIVDQVHFAASLLSGHPDLFYQLSFDLDHRLQIAHTVADEWQGAQTGLRVALTGAMTATTGLLAHTANSTKANQGAQKADKNAGMTASPFQGAAASKADALWLLERGRDLWHVLNLPGTHLLQMGPLDAAFAVVGTAVDTEKSVAANEDPAAALGKAVLENAGGFVIERGVDAGMASAAGAAGVTVTGPVVVAALAIGGVATDEFKNVVEESYKVDWASEMAKNGPHAVQDEQPYILAKATLDTGVDVWNTAAYSLALTGEAGRVAGQELRDGVVGVGRCVVGLISSGDATK